MSLIEEALRKQESEEAMRNSPSAPSATGTAPAPVAPAAISPQPFNPPGVSPAAITRPIHPDAGRQRNLTRMMFAGIGMLVLLLVAGVVFLAMVRATRPAGPTVAAPATDAVVVAMATQAPPAALPAPATDAVVVAMATQAPPAATAVVGAANLVTNAIAAAAASTGREAVVVPAPVVPPPVVTWPEIVVKGTFSSNGKTLVLLGDGLTLETGVTTPSGVRLLGAGPGWVRVSYKGQTRTYRRNGGAFTAEPAADSPQP